MLSRKAGQSIIIGDNEIIITVTKISENYVSLGIKADKNVPVHREEIYNRIKENKKGILNLINTTFKACL